MKPHSIYFLQSFFNNIFSDAIDSDFSKGNILHTNFKNIGGDAIDYSGSNSSIKNVLPLYLFELDISTIIPTSFLLLKGAFTLNPILILSRNFNGTWYEKIL